MNCIVSNPLLMGMWSAMYHRSAKATPNAAVVRNSMAGRIFWSRTLVLRFRMLLYAVSVKEIKAQTKHTMKRIFVVGMLL